MTKHTVEIANEKIVLTETEPFVYQGSFKDIQFICKRWSWGQKNEAIDMAIRYHKASQRYYTDTIAQNENMVRACFTSILQDEKKVQVDDIDSNAGDALLEICLWVNQQASPDIPRNTSPAPQGKGYVLDTPALHASFKPWTWGEKNRAVKSASFYNSEAEEMHLATGKFSESLLLHSLSQLRWQEKDIPLTPQQIHDLPVDLGDFLVEIAVEINNVSEQEKKT